MEPIFLARDTEKTVPNYEQAPKQQHSSSSDGKGV